MFEFILFGMPIILIIFFCVSIDRYISAKKQNKESPGTYSDTEIKKRKITLILSGVVAGIFVVIIIGLIVLLSMAVAYM